MPIKAPLEFAFAVAVIIVCHVFSKFCDFHSICLNSYLLLLGCISGELQASFFMCWSACGVYFDTNSNARVFFWDLLQDNFARSNNEVRRLQAESLLNSFEQHPLFGVGLGQPLHDIKRSVVAPWSYELTYHAMLSQRGAIGFFGNIGVIWWCLITAFIQN